MSVPQICKMISSIVSCTGMIYFPDGSNTCCPCAEVWKIQSEANSMISQTTALNAENPIIKNKTKIVDKVYILLILHKTYTAI